MNSSSRFSCAGGLVWLFWLAALSRQSVFADLELQDWSNSKTNDRTTMFLVQPGERITFRLKVEDAESFSWLVNKRAASAASRASAEFSSSFVWTAPHGKGIWEIHAEASGEDKRVHHEWVLSSLEDSEAPVLFDYFTDRRYAERKEPDPWGRPLPEWRPWAFAADWTEWQELWRFLPGGRWGRGYGPWYKKLIALDTSGCFLQAPSVAPEPQYARHLMTVLTAKTGVEFGTWKFRFCFPNGLKQMTAGRTHFRFYFAYVSGYYCFPFWYGVASDGFNAFRVAGSAFDQRAQSPVDSAWHEVTVIRTPDNELYSFVDGNFQFRGKTARRTPEQDVALQIALARFQPDRYPRDTVYIDCVEVYKKCYLFPAGWNRARAILKSRKGKGAEEARYILVRGRAVRLEEIAKAVAHPELFRYEKHSAQAVSGVDLVVDRGADLVLRGESLRFEPKGRPSCTLTVHPTGALRAERSSILNAQLLLDRPFDVCLNRTRLVAIVKLHVSVPTFTMGAWKFDRLQLTDKGKSPELLILLPDDNVGLNLYNCELAGATVAAGTADTQSSPVLGLVNCRFGRLKPLGKARIAVKYFLDVRVVDTQGRPVPGARVTVRNELDDINFPSENREEFQPHGGGRTGYLSESVLPRLITYTHKRSARTGPDGHTPRPDDRRHTLIVTDLVTDRGSKRQFTYTITAVAPGARRGQVTGVDPNPTWFRTDPNVPKVTVTVVAKQ